MLTSNTVFISMEKMKNGKYFLNFNVGDLLLDGLFDLRNIRIFCPRLLD